MLKHLVIELANDNFVHVYADEARTESLIKEAGKGKGQNLTGPYYFQKHQPHVPGGQYHLHLYEKQNQLFAINWDGTAHDDSHGSVIPNRVYDELRNRFPTLNLPADKRIANVFPLTLGKIIKTAQISATPLEELVELQALVSEAVAQ